MSELTDEEYNTIAAYAMSALADFEERWPGLTVPWVGFDVEYNPGYFELASFTTRNSHKENGKSMRSKGDFTSSFGNPTARTSLLKKAKQLHAYIKENTVP